MRSKHHAYPHLELVVGNAVKMTLAICGIYTGMISARPAALPNDVRRKPTLTLETYLESLPEVARMRPLFLYANIRLIHLIVISTASATSLVLVSYKLR